MMSPADAIIGSTVVIVGTTIIREQRTKPTKGKAPRPTYELIIYGFLLAIGLLFLAIPFPAVATALAYLGLAGALALNGSAVFGLIGGLGK